MKNLKERIYQILECRLLVYGFEKKKLDNYVRIINNNVLQNVVFSYATHSKKNAVYFNPIVGVIYKDIDSMMVALKELNISRTQTFTPMIGCPIGSLMPVKTFKEWKFTKNEPIDETANEMADFIIKYGIPYLDMLSNEENLVYGMEVGSLGSDMRDYVLPILYYIRGNTEKALSFLDEVIKRRTLDFPIDEYKAMQAIYGEDAIQIPPNKELDSYLPFVENFKKFLSENSL